MRLFNYNWFKTADAVQSPPPPIPTEVDGVIREQMLTINAPVYTVTDWWRIVGLEGEHATELKLEKPNSVLISYNPTGKSLDRKVTQLSYTEFVEKFKNAFFGDENV